MWSGVLSGRKEEERSVLEVEEENLEGGETDVGTRVEKLARRFGPA